MADIMDTKYIIGFLIGIVIIVGAVALIAGNQPKTPSQYNLAAFAQCLTDKKVLFYGAFWCPHCQATKKVFGDAESKLPYVECSTADGQRQLQICIDQKIEGYPTWVFPDGSRLTGELSGEAIPPKGSLSLNDLAQKSGCTLLPNVTSSSTTETLVATSTATSTATTTP